MMLSKPFQDNILYEHFQEHCVFCKIVSGTIPTAIIAQNDMAIAIKDIHPKAPIHYLVISRSHMENIMGISQEHLYYMVGITSLVQELGKTLGADASFRLLSNNGAGAGQSVFHLHFHFLSGKKMLDF